MLCQACKINKERARALRGSAASKEKTDKKNGSESSFAWEETGHRGKGVRSGSVEKLGYGREARQEIGR